ncbi:hypothetical protein HIB41_004588, partial [Escherichia coli]|nr:hypothetical protein [Escherichia coli]
HYNRNMHVICLLLFLLQKNLSIFLNISEILIKGNYYVYAIKQCPSESNYYR